ncbi:transcriptional regulator [Pectobacterium carotovorum]|uniref:transcriptional regulator n=1 Tax=Pectobacterium carotovorum TaxID=554 RepID=UPI0029D6AEBB|nr:transcriptional regulator [Pectobacterium carotovorum]MDX6917784.1 transcriptional regulator [Pectobacterium carotovorum]
MLSQLTLRFPKNLIERLKNRATTENTSVNALAERLMETSLQGSAAGEEYLRLATDPDEALRQLYRQLILGQHFGVSSPSRATLQFLLELAHQGYSRGQGQLINISRLQVLLEITFALLDWQVENQQEVDAPYLKGTFGLRGDDWQEECRGFLQQLTPGITQDYAEQLLRPLASGAFDLNTFPDEVLATVFTRRRLQTLFPLCIYARDWDFDTRRRFMDQVRPVIPAERKTFDAGTIQFDIRISGQEPGIRSGGWYENPRLYLLLTGQDFIMPFGWESFSELLRILTVYHSHPNILHHGYQGQRAMFSPRETADNQVVIGLDTLRVYLTEARFAELVPEFVTCFSNGELTASLESLQCLYGDL